MVPGDRCSLIVDRYMQQMLYSMKTYFPSDMELGTAFTFQDVASISKTTAHRTICVKPADDVEIEYDGKVEYCTIEKIVLAQCGDRKYLWVVPHWYTATITRTKTPKLHNIRQTPLLTRAHLREDRQSPMVPCSGVLQQILVVHSCERTTTSEDMKCCVRSVCSVHSVFGCEECVPGNTVEVDHHVTGNISFEVINRAAGFTTRNHLAKS